MQGIHADAHGEWLFGGNQLQLAGGYIGSKENEALRRKHRLAPALGCIELGWKYGAEVCSADGLPFIGPYSPGTPNLFVASGYGGQGILGSVIAAQAISARILGLPSEGYEVYSPKRRWDWKLPAKEGMRYLRSALFRSSAPCCPHMGCRMIYRAEHRIWECPCHGSCFDDLGRVLSAPAVRDADARKR